MSLTSFKISYSAAMSYSENLTPFGEAGGAAFGEDVELSRGLLLSRMASPSPSMHFFSSSIYQRENRHAIQVGYSYQQIDVSVEVVQVAMTGSTCKRRIHYVACTPIYHDESENFACGTSVRGVIA